MRFCGELKHLFATVISRPTGVTLSTRPLPGGTCAGQRYTMEKWLSSILARIATGELLPDDCFGSLDCDAALDARDRDAEFDAEWVRLDNEVSRRWDARAVESSLSTLAEDIRRESFLAVSRATGQHEIAGYVSDDFDLIIRVRLLGITEPLLDQMWGVYERGEFPIPPL